ncbi:MAG: hypothetical protein HW412_1, partial [Bacteroidetes bacterium]|nr:hypothetical protein [Bacteroidota bacterium]
MQFNKLYLSISLLLIGAIWVACVDIPSGPGTNVNPNFRSTVRFFHAAQSRAANSITIDGAAAGPSMSYLGNSGYLDVASGSRSLSFGGSTAVTQAFGSEQQSTLVVYEVPAAGGGTDVAYLNLVEGHYKTNNGVAGFAKVKFVNAANGAAATVAFRKNAATPASNTIATAAFGAAPQYLQLDPDTAGGAGISVFGISSGGYQTSDIKGANEVPPVTSGSTGSGTVDFLTGDSLIMNATVKSMNSEGFYTSAHIHNGAAGVAGPVLYPLLADSQ